MKMGRLLVLLAMVIGSATETMSAPAHFVGKWGQQGSGEGEFHYPFGIAVGPDGSVYVADHGNDRIQKFTNDGQFIIAWGGQGAGDGQFDEPFDVAVDGSGSVFVVEVANQRVQKFSGSGTFITKWGQYGTCDGQFTGSVGIGVDADGFVYVADQGNNRIQKFTNSGAFVTKWGSWNTPCWPGDWEGPYLNSGDIAAANGSVFVSDQDNQGFKKFSTSGQLENARGGPGGSGNGQFSLPWGITVDDAGQIYVCDVINNRIQVFSPNGSFLSVIGSYGTGDGQFDQPYRVAVDGAGNVFVADTYNHRIQKFSTEGITAVERAWWGQIKNKYR